MAKVAWQFSMPLLLRVSERDPWPLERRPVSARKLPLELLDPLRPILLEQPRERAVGEQSPLGLATRTVVRLVVRIANALDGGPAHGTRLAVLPVHSHFRAKRRHFLRKLAISLRTKALHPFAQYGLRRVVDPADLLVGESRRERHRRHAAAVENLVRVGVTDAAEESRVRKGALDRVILRAQSLRELVDRALERLQPAAIELDQRLLTSNQMQRRTLLRSGFGQHECSVGEL